MSLKGFHILFITLAFLCAAGFWAWCLWNPDVVERLGIGTLANLGASLAIGLFIYGLWFIIKKSRTIIV